MDKSKHEGAAGAGRGAEGNEERPLRTVGSSTTAFAETNPAPRRDIAEQADPDVLRTELPLAMQSARRWLLWRAEPAERGGKPRKVPYYADGTRRRGHLDSAEDVSRLVDLTTALAAMESGAWAGLGFALGPDGAGNHWQGIDLDGTDKRPDLLSLVDSLPGYVERSPSGNGYHSIGMGSDFPSLGANRSGIEAYSHGRFFTVTGDAIRGDLEDLAQFVATTLAPLHTRAEAPKSRAVSAPDAPITEGARNETLFRLGASMRSKGFGEPAILSVITVIDGLAFTISDGWERLRAETAHCPCRNPWPHGCAAVT